MKLTFCFTSSVSGTRSKSEHFSGRGALKCSIPRFCGKKIDDYLFGCLDLRCFDTVFQRPYKYFLIALKVVFSLSNHYKIFTSNWLWIQICQNLVLSKIDITMTTINKKL